MHCPFMHVLSPHTLHTWQQGDILTLLLSNRHSLPDVTHWRPSLCWILLIFLILLGKPLRTLLNWNLLPLGVRSFVVFSFLFFILSVHTHILVTLGNYQVTDIGWMALCSSSRGIRRLHIPECPRMTNSSLRAMATLKSLHHLDISHCYKFVHWLILHF